MSAGVLVERGLACPMRDGVTLATDVYRPNDDDRHPVLLLRTPYDRTLSLTTWLSADPIKLAEAGYVVAFQDVRGRFASDGDFEDMYVAEEPDGADAVEWAGAQPWADGNVGVYGVSYMGGSAWLAAAGRPAGLGAILTTQAPGDFPRGVRRNGAYQLGLLSFWTLVVMGADLVRRKVMAGQAAPAELLELIDDVDGFDARVQQVPLVPFAPLDGRAGGIGSWFTRLAGEESPDGRHGPKSVAGRHEQVTVPVLQIAGWYDLLLGGDLSNYAGIRDSAGSEEARSLSRLVVGPWAHGAFNSAVGEIDYGVRAAGLALDLKGDLTQLHARWFDQRLRGIDTGIDDEPRVSLFVMGANRWRGFADWPPPSTPAEWYLQPGGGLGPAAPEVDEASSEFRLDPANPVPTRGGTILLGGSYARGPVDQRPTEAHPDVLTFTSAPLESPLEIIGPVTLVAWVASETVDSDVVAKLCDVHPDGRSINIVDGIQRLRFRDGDDPQPMPPGEPVRVEVDLWATAQVFKAGHRLRVHVCASDFPRYDRCPGTGHSAATAAEIAPQRNRVFHDADRPSHLVLPVTS